MYKVVGFGSDTEDYTSFIAHCYLPGGCYMYVFAKSIHVLYTVFTSAICPQLKQKQQQRQIQKQRNGQNTYTIKKKLFTVKGGLRLRV